MQRKPKTGVFILIVTIVILLVSLAGGGYGLVWGKPPVNSCPSGQVEVPVGSSGKVRCETPTTTLPPTTTTTTTPPPPPTTTTTTTTTTTPPTSTTTSTSTTLPATTTTTTTTTTVPVTTTTTTQPEYDSAPIWLSTSEIMSLPTSGVAWQNVLAKASAFDSTKTEYDNQDSIDPRLAYAAALVSVRLNDTSLRNEIVLALSTISSSPFDKGNGSVLGWARNLTAWVLAADIIDLKSVSPSVHSDFSSWLSSAMSETYVGDGCGSLSDCVNRANNIGVHSRLTTMVIKLYLERDITNDVGMYRALYVAPDPRFRFDWYKTHDRSWQCDPTNGASWMAINPVDNCVSQGVDLAGVLPEEYRRNGSFDPNTFPGPSSTKYTWEGSTPALIQGEILRRNGYPDALTWGDSAVLRSYERVYQNHLMNSQWEWPPNSFHCTDIFAVNGIYGTDLTTNGCVESYGRPLGFFGWTHNS